MIPTSATRTLIPEHAVNYINSASVMEENTMRVSLDKNCNALFVEKDQIVYNDFEIVLQLFCRRFSGSRWHPRQYKIVGHIPVPHQNVAE